MPESFDFATTDPGSGGENLAGDRLTQGADTLFVPAAYLVHGAAGGPYTRVEAGAGLPVAATQAGVWTVAVSGGVSVTNAGTFAVQASQSGAWAVTAHAGTGPWPVTDNAGSLTVDDGGGSLTVDAVSLPLPAGAAAEATLAALSAKVTACDTGAVLVAGGNVVVSATDLDVRSLSSATDSVAAVQSGAWSVGVSGTVDVSAAALPLPAGAATEATLAALSAKVTACNTGAVVVASGSVTVADGGGSLTVDNGGTFAVQASQSGTWAVTDGGGSLTVDGTVAATQSGAWTVGVSGGVNIRTLDYAADSVSAYQAGTWQVLQQGTWTVSAILEAPSGTQLTSHALGSADALDVCLLDAAGDQLTAFPVTDNGGSLTVDGTVAVSGAVAVQQGAGTSTLANVSASASSVTLLAANADRRLAVVHNDSTAVLYVKFGTTASATDFTYKLAAGDTLEVTHYTGRLDGIWASATGTARVTEVD